MYTYCGDPDIAVVLPVFNGEDYISECIESVLRQQYSNFELIIGDDGSDDSTREIITSFKDERIRFTAHQDNRGLFGNLNWLISQTRAPLIHFLCQDDRLEPDCLGQEIAFLAEHPEVGMTYCKVILLDAEGTVTGKTPLFDLPSVLPSSLSLQYFYYLGCLPGNLSTVCARRSLLESSGLFDTSLIVAGDYDMWVRICHKASLGIIHQYLVQLRIHSGQLSRAHSSGLPFFAETRRIRQKIMAVMPSVIQPAAEKYEQQRWNVYNFHFAVRCLLAGNLRDTRGALQMLGLRSASVAAFYWLISANNRLRKPKRVIYANV